tara:strand:- start:354 stop:1178 length:825 start_codon:yes stop_codon:yes gene_type:complete
MKIENLVEDIYTVLEEDHKISDDNLNLFLEGISSALVNHLSSTRKNNRPTLRMSSIGKKDRKLWLELKQPKDSALPSGSTLLKFLYGSILEELLLFLVRESGHTVTDAQKKVTVNGVDGHMDCKIDGEVVDVKSASDFSFKKFMNGSILSSDSFGYVAQLSGYIEAEGDEQGHFLVINKVTGELTLFTVDDMDTINVSKRIDHLRNILSVDTVPELCYNPIPEGKSGNMKLANDCVYCPYKFDCFPDTRVFKYSNKNVYLSKVIKEPVVEEVLV